MCWAISLAPIGILKMSATQFDIDLQKWEGKSSKLAWKVNVRHPPCIRNWLLIPSIGHGLRPPNSVPSATPAVPLPSLGVDMEMPGEFPKQGLVVNFKHCSFSCWPMSRLEKQALEEGKGHQKRREAISIFRTASISHCRHPSPSYPILDYYSGLCWTYFGFSWHVIIEHICRVRCDVSKGQWSGELSSSIPHFRH